MVLFAPSDVHGTKALDPEDGLLMKGVRRTLRDDLEEFGVLGFLPMSKPKVPVHGNNGHGKVL